MALGRNYSGSMKGVGQDLPLIEAFVCSTLYVVCMYSIFISDIKIENT